MGNKLQLFYNEEANVTIRTQQLNNEPWFVAKDVANALDIAWSGATLSKTAPAPAPSEVPPVLRGMEAAGEALYQPERVGRGGRRYRC